MGNSWDYRIQLTDEEESIKDKVLELLYPLNEESTSRMTAYFEEVDEDGDQIEELGTEYDVCDDDECINDMLVNLKLSYPDKKIDYRLYHNNGDHENIERCHQCGKPLNEFLTWVKWEFDYIEDNMTIEDIKSNTFDLIAVFQSFPSIDYEVSGYDLNQKMLGNNEPIERTLKNQKEFKDKVMGLMNHVIKQIESFKTSS